MHPGFPRHFTLCKSVLLTKCPLSYRYVNDPLFILGAKQIEKEAKRRGLCIAYEAKIPSNDKEDPGFYESISKNLLLNYRARVVILFLGETHGYNFFNEFEKRNITGYFVWIASDSLSSEDLGPSADGLITMLYTLGNYAKFDHHYKYLVPGNSSGNPWFAQLWEMYYDCNWNNGSCDVYKQTPKPDQPVTTWASKQYDGVWVYAYALNKLINHTCPQAYYDKTILLECTRGRNLLPYLKNVSFEGISGKIKFDGNGDLIGEYNLFQYKYYPSKKSGVNV